MNVLQLLVWRLQQKHMFLHVFIAFVSLRQNVGGSAGREDGEGVAQKAFPSQLRATDIPVNVRFSEIFWQECARAFMSASARVRALGVLLSNWNMNPFTFSCSCWKCYPDNPAYTAPPFEVFFNPSSLFFVYVI